MPLIDPSKFKVRPNHRAGLRNWRTQVPPYYRSEDHYRQISAHQQSKLDALQRLLFAGRARSVLVIFQGMDTAGKDHSIKHIFSCVNPAGCQVSRFEAPSDEQRRHDFLWRAYCRLPEHGNIGIFNRSYYEDVLIVRVHPELHPRHTDWNERYQSIIDMERHLSRSGTQFVKIFLNLSREEQRKRFLARIDELDKNWKFSAADIEERKYWKKYMYAYRACLAATSTKIAPWYMVPADDKKNSALIIGQILIDTLQGLKLKYPEPDAARRRKLLAIRKQLL
jgi:PPK2 family polyphosphate:nucleotide phosphotransferase